MQVTAPSFGWGWSAPGAAVIPLCALVVLYLRGWRRLRQNDATRWNAARLGCMVAGVAVLAIALWSPLDSLAQFTLTAHMTQHMLLTMVAPPLLLLAFPFAPLLAGLPTWIARDLCGPLLGWPVLQKFFARLVSPPLAWSLAVASMWIWHFPTAYEWALQNPWAHALEHACFLWTGILFWWPVVQPWPWKGSWPRWSMAFYLLAADLANTLVAAILAFAPDAIYATYRLTGPALGTPALLDQQRAAVIMWLPGSMLYLLPAVVIIVKTLSPRRAPRVVSLPMLTSRAHRVRWDATRLPVLGALLRNANARLAFRFVVLALAAIVVIDGFLGPREAATNIAGTWPWTHWRGLAAVSMVLAGNLACMGCPLIAPRTLLRRWIKPTLRIPLWLRRKWIAVAAIFVWLIAYEACGWWDSPRLTAALIVGFILVATCVDLIFEGSSFCQWMCPIGQWNMALSVASPMQVEVRDPGICEGCQTQDCLRGGARGPGCGTSIFLPRKVGSLDCTACLDCVTACPHDNAGAFLVIPFHEVPPESTRSAIGKWVQRPDLAALLLVLEAGAFANAALMTEPAVHAVNISLSDWPRTIMIVGAVLVLMQLVVLPLAVMAVIGAWLRTEPFKQRIARMIFDLWPIGVAMWLVHFGFHLVTGWKSALPPLQRAARDGLHVDLGAPAWTSNCCATVPSWLLPTMLALLGLGLVIALQLCWLRASASWVRPRIGVIVLSWIPDALVALCWWAFAVWIVLQPMQMRGLLL